MRIGLSIDWDWFFDDVPTGRDYVPDHLTSSSATLRGTRENVLEFWNKFPEPREAFGNAPLLVCETHAWAAPWFTNMCFTINLDAHSDNFPSRFPGYTSCDSWAYELGNVVWWKDHDVPKLVGHPTVFDRVLLCRSAPWTPPGEDDLLINLVWKYPGPVYYLDCPERKKLTELTISECLCGSLVPQPWPTAVRSDTSILMLGNHTGY